MSKAKAIPAGVAGASHRDRALRDLLGLLSSLFALTIAGYVLVTYVTQTTPTRNAWPMGLAVNTASAYALSLDEQEQFDRAALRASRTSVLRGLSEAHLPPMLPTVRSALNIHPTTLWAIPGNYAPLRTTDVAAALLELETCAKSAACSLRQPDDKDAHQQIVRALGRQQPGIDDLCGGEPHRETLKRVPTGLYAIALSWVPRCHPKAIMWFNDYERRLSSNLALEELPKPFAEMGALYAKLAIAKLKQRQQEPGSAEFRKAINEVRDSLTVDAKADLKHAYDNYEDLPAWGISTAEVRAAWIMASAREKARHASGQQLAKELQEHSVTSAELNRLRLNPTPGQAYLTNVWCAMTFRAGADMDMLRDCVDVLLGLALPRSLQCAIVARKTILAGIWQTDARSSCTPASIDAVFSRVAKKDVTWKQALARYNQSDLEQSERDSLRKYLETYAADSGNRRDWFRHENPKWHVVINVGTGVVAALWLFGAWALWRWWTLRRRFLPPRLTADLVKASGP